MEFNKVTALTTIIIGICIFAAAAWGIHLIRSEEKKEKEELARIAAKPPVKTAVAKKAVPVAKKAVKKAPVKKSAVKVAEKKAAAKRSPKKEK
jgi:hypothetical protein